MKIEVRIISGHNSPWYHEFSEQEITFGRSEKADVRLHPEKDTPCSRGIHARLLNTGDTLLFMAEHESGVRVSRPGGRTIVQLAKDQSFPIQEEIEATLGEGGPTVRISPLKPQQRIPVTQKPQGELPVQGIPGEVVREPKVGKRRVYKAMALILVVLAVAGGAILYRLKRAETRFEPLEASRTTLMEHVADLRNSVAPLTEAHKHSLENVLRDAQSSVYVVCAKGKEGGLTNMATAWTVRPGLLATNAHVAEAVEKALDDGNRGFIARLTSSPPKDLVVTKTSIHPGYRHWQGVLQQGLLRRGFSQIETVVFAPLCDVALLQVEGDTGKPLELASANELKTLRSADPIGYVGYPAENVLGNRLNSPPSLVLGHILNMSSFFCQNVSCEQAYLLQHDLVAVGGSSGSPILNTAGHVVALLNSGSVVMVGSQRVPIGINCAQRVDLLSELLEPSRAEKEQQGRDIAWQKDLAFLTLSPEETLGEVVKQTVLNLIKGGKVKDGAIPEPVKTIKEPLAVECRKGNCYQIEVERGKIYGAVACAADWSDVDMVVTAEAGELGKDTSLNQLARFWWVSSNSGKVTIRAFAEHTNLVKTPLVYLQVVALPLNGSE